MSRFSRAFSLQQIPSRRKANGTPYRRASENGESAAHGLSAGVPPGRQDERVRLSQRIQIRNAIAQNSSAQTAATTERQSSSLQKRGIQQPG